MSLKVIISGGGTGGHIFPAIAIANTLKRMIPEAKILFVGANGKMEMEKVPAAGYEIVGLNITGIKRSLSASNLAFPFKLLGSLIKARQILKSFKPNVVVGVGGFASGPVLRMATWMKMPSLIQEQNSFAGVTNRWVANSVNRVCVAYDGMEKFFPPEAIRKTGNPVRKEMVSIQGKKEEALSFFGLAERKPVVLVVGGSLGALSVNRALQTGIDQLLEAGIQVIWQTGKNFEDLFDQMKEKHNDQPLYMTRFIKEMDLAYAAADVIVSRAGAIAVSELALVKKPCILVPFPFAAEDHQKMNALSLVNDDAALMIEDRDANTKLTNAIIDLVKDEAMRQKLSSNIAAFGTPTAADDIANEIIKLAGNEA